MPLTPSRLTHKKRKKKKTVTMRHGSMQAVFPRALISACAARNKVNESLDQARWRHGHDQSRRREMMVNLCQHLLRRESWNDVELESVTDGGVRLKCCRRLGLIVASRTSRSLHNKRFTNINKKEAPISPCGIHILIMVTL